MSAQAIPDLSSDTNVEEDELNKHLDNLLSETRREIEELPEVAVEYRSCLLEALNKKERFRRMKQENIRAPENGVEDFLKDVDPEEELHPKQDELHNVERGKEDLHGATEGRTRNRGHIVDSQYELYLEDLKKQYALQNQKEGSPVCEENEVSDEPVNLQHGKEDLHGDTERRKRKCGHIDSQYGLYLEDLKKHYALKNQKDVLPVCKANEVSDKPANLEYGKEDLCGATERRKRNKSSMQRTNKDKGENADRGWCKKRHREISPNQEQHGDGYGARGCNKRYLRSSAKREGDSMLLNGLEDRRCREKPGSSERIKKLRSRKTYKMRNLEGEDENGYGDDDVEILDKTLFNKMTEASSVPVARGEGTPLELSYRQQIISLLRKPYDAEEHKELRAAVAQHKAKEIFRDFCNGRERFCKTNEEGKSYLDHYPDFNRKLELHRDNIPRCLNLLRGFFFWLQNSTQQRSFRPWRDLECLKTYPGRIQDWY